MEQTLQTLSDYSNDLVTPDVKRAVVATLVSQIPSQPATSIMPIFAVGLKCVTTVACFHLFLVSPYHVF